MAYIITDQQSHRGPRETSGKIPIQKLEKSETDRGQGFRKKPYFFCNVLYKDFLSQARAVEKAQRLGREQWPE